MKNFTNQELYKVLRRVTRASDDTEFVVFEDGKMDTWHESHGPLEEEPIYMVKVQGIREDLDYYGLIDEDKELIICNELHEYIDDFLFQLECILKER